MTQLPSPLKSADWLIDHLHDASVPVLDCRYALSDPLVGRIAYLENHIPGAVYADLETDLSGPVREDGSGGRHPLPDPASLAEWLGGVGIGKGSVVVAYDDPGTGQGFYAARAWWVLRWLGHAQVYVLDGGWPAYLAAGGAGDAAEVSHAPVTFTPDVQSGLLATVEEVVNRAPDTLLIDSRAPARYRGETEPLDRKAGHIPGAINRDWSGALDGAGGWHDGGLQAARLETGHSPTITYCGSGVSAASNLLARELAGVALGPDNRLYAGSWSDWVSDDTRPVAVGEENGG